MKTTVNHSPKTFAAIVIFFISIGISLAQDGVGRITAVIGPVNIINGGTKEKSPAIKGGILQENDLIQTEAGGKAKIILHDQTILSIGPEAELVVDKFVLGGEANQGSVGVSFKKGLFKYLSGDVAKNKGDVQLKIPNAVITVRGTSGTFNITSGGDNSIATTTGVLAVTSTTTGVTTEISAGYQVTTNGNSGAVTQFISVAANCNAN